MTRLLLTTLCLTCMFMPASRLLAQSENWQNLVGSDLKDWQKVGGTASYELVDGVIVGKTGTTGPNTFLTRGPYADFILEFEVKCDPKLNSGVQIRSQVYAKDTPQESKPDRIRKAGETYGYQIEICGSSKNEFSCTGNFWDEGRRTKWLDEKIDGTEKQQAYKPDEWNRMRIIAQGNRIRSFVNDVPVADFTDDRDATGFIGLQVHAIKAGTGPYQVAWKNIRIRELKQDEKVVGPTSK